jgi:hypothetical protein
VTGSRLMRMGLCADAAMSPKMNCGRRKSEFGEQGNHEQNDPNADEVGFPVRPKIIEAKQEKPTRYKCSCLIECPQQRRQRTSPCQPTLGAPG